MKEGTWSKTSFFGGLIEITKSDLYRFHLRMGSVAVYRETPKLYAIVKEARHRERVGK